MYFTSDENARKLEMKDKTPCPGCESKFTQSIRIGRANYKCEDCGFDKSLIDYYWHEATQKTSEKKSPKYQCGHRQEAIILDDNILSLSAYYDWIGGCGYKGDESMCWECYCSSKTSTKSEENK